MKKGTIDFAGNAGPPPGGGLHDRQGGWTPNPPTARHVEVPVGVDMRHPTEAPRLREGRRGVRVPRIGARRRPP
ncbi:MAG: hypothetical protein AAB289_12405, partial [Chloroflexota bacterium]